MTFTLRLFVMGLVAVVKGLDSKEFTFVLPYESGHFPILICDPNSSCTLSSSDQGSVIRDASHINQPDQGKVIKGYLLSDEEISINGSVAGGPRLIDSIWAPSWFHHATGVVPDNRQQGVDTSWMPPMFGILRQARFINEDILLKPVDNKIKAILRLSDTSATISAFHLAERCGLVPSLTFKRLGSGMKLWGVKQALADVLLLEIPVAGDEVKIVLGKYGAAGTRIMTLKPANGERVVDALVGNLSPLVPVDELENSTTVDHFSHFYALSAVAVSSEDRLIPHIGFRKAKSAEVNPLHLPAVLNVVSGEGDICSQGEGGLSRPMCTFGYFETP